MDEELRGVPIGELPDLQSIPEDSLLVAEFLDKAYKIPGDVLRQLIQDIFAALGGTLDDVTEARLTAAVEAVLASGKYNGVSPLVEVTTDENGRSVLHVVDAYGIKDYPVEVQGATDAVRYVAQTLTEAQKKQARENIGALSTDDVSDNDNEVVIVKISGSFDAGYTVLWGENPAPAKGLDALVENGSIVIGVADGDLTFNFLDDADYNDFYTVPAGTVFSYRNSTFWVSHIVDANGEIINATFVIYAPVEAWLGEVRPAQYTIYLTSDQPGRIVEYLGRKLEPREAYEILLDAANNDIPLLCYQKDAVFKLEDGSTHTPQYGTPFYYDHNTELLHCEHDGYECTLYVDLDVYNATAEKNTPYKTAESKGDDLEVEEGELFLLSGGERIGSGVSIPSGGSSDAVQYVEQTLTDTQKTQARTNIGAAADNLFIGKYSTVTFSEIYAAANANKHCVLEAGNTLCLLQVCSDTMARFQGTLPSGNSIRVTINSDGTRQSEMVYLNAVQYVEQTLTDEQQKQVRENIGVSEMVRVSLSGDPDGYTALLDGEAVTGDTLNALVQGGNTVIGIAESDMAFDVSADLIYVVRKGTIFQYSNAVVYFNSVVHRLEFRVQLEGNDFALYYQGGRWLGKGQSAHISLHLYHDDASGVVVRRNWDSISAADLKTLLLNSLKRDRPIICYQANARFYTEEGDTVAPHAFTPFYFHVDTSGNYSFICEYDGYQCTLHVSSSGYSTTAEKIEAGGTPDAVQYVEQTLTDEQKTQARSNIGAAADNLFIGTYGTVTYAELLAALNAGKRCFVDLPGVAFCDLLDYSADQVRFQGFLPYGDSIRLYIKSDGTKSYEYFYLNALQYTEQYLSDAQKAQARSNIGALGQSNVAIDKGSKIEGATAGSSGTTPGWITESTLYVRILDEEGAEIKSGSITAIDPYNKVKALGYGSSDSVFYNSLKNISDTVLTVSQSLTASQKTQARSNIGAVGYIAPTNVAGTEQVTAKLYTSNGGSIAFGKEGPNSGTMIRLDQVDGTCRLRFRASATAGAMVWEQPEQGAQLYVDLGKDGVDKHRISFPAGAGTLALTSQLSGYLPLSGGTMTGALNLKNSTWNLAGDDAYFGDNDTAGSFAIKGANGTTNLKMVTHNGTSYGTLSWNGSNFVLSNALNFPGGTVSGNLIATGGIDIRGTAASNPLKVRGIVGSDGNGTVAELYLQYGASKALMLGNTGAYNISADGSTYSGNAATATMPLGFSSRVTGATWGNTIGTSFTSWNDPTGGSIDFRYDNPSSGKLSMKVDGRVYVNEGLNPVMASEQANGFWGMTSPDGENNVWIRTTTQGIIPYQSGAAGAGHCSLGTSTWYFANAYIDKVYGSNFSGLAAKATADANGANIASTYAKLAAGNTFNGEQRMVNSSYAPTMNDIASGVGCSLKNARACDNQLIVAEIFAPTTAATDSTINMNAVVGEIGFYHGGSGSNGQFTGKTQLARITSAGIYEGSTLLANKYLAKSGGTMTGDLTVGSAKVQANGYVKGTWLQTTANNATTSKVDQVCVQSNGWIYTRTLDQLRGDMGAASVPLKVTLSGSTASKTPAEIKSAYDQGQLVFLEYSNQVFGLSTINSNVASFTTVLTNGTQITVTSVIISASGATAIYSKNV